VTTRGVGVCEGRYLLIAGVNLTPWVHSCRLGNLFVVVGRHRIFVCVCPGNTETLVCGRDRKSKLYKLPLTGFGQPCVALDLLSLEEK